MNIGKALLVSKMQIYFADKPFLFVEIFFAWLIASKFFHEVCVGDAAYRIGKIYKFVRS